MSNFYLIMDESGHLHPNSTGRYFVIGGFLSKEPTKIQKIFRKTNRKLKEQKGLDMKAELKGSELKSADKRYLMEKINKAEDTDYVFIVIDKNMVSRKKIEEVNLFYNYAISILLQCIANRNMIPEDTKLLKIILDNRSIKLGTHKSLEDYLNTQVIIEEKIKGNFKVNCEYLESHNHYGIQAADLLCNITWAKYNYPETDKVSKLLEEKSSIFKFPLDDFGK